MMLALSMRQPWIWAVLHAGKRIENRRQVVRGKIRPPSFYAYRGPILLHAAKGCTAGEAREAFDFMRDRFGSEWMMRHGPPRLENMPRGGICGRARIVGIIEPHDGDHVLQCGQEWHMHDQYGLVLDDIEELSFRPYPGSLGLFRVPDYP